MKFTAYIFLIISISCSLPDSKVNHKGNAYSKQFYAFAKDQMHDPDLYEFMDFQLDTFRFEDLPEFYLSIGMDEEQIEEALKTASKDDQYFGKIRFRANSAVGAKKLHEMTIYYDLEMKIDRIK